VAYSLFWDNVGEDLPAALQGGDGLLFADPQLVAFSADQDCTDDQPWPDAGSPLIDAGDPALSDPDGSRSDIGAFGGPDADTDVFVDEDGDGWTAASDCDDDDPTIHPDAEERCDGVDNDCDGTIDVGATDGSTFYADGDDDGYGVESQTIQACEAPEGYAELPGDCDDSLATVHPDAPEICDAIDNDCDQEVDESAEGWWPDADGDGYGDENAEPVQACTPGDGLTDNGLDCDDTDAAIHPAAEDAPDDGIDSNCDGIDGVATPDPNADEDLKVGASCGCATGPGPAPWLLLLPALAVARRRR
jgi:MYXO-CTERM domain-containing protein